MKWGQARLAAGKDQKVVIRLLATATDKDYHCSPEVARFGREQVTKATSRALTDTLALTARHYLATD